MQPHWRERDYSIPGRVFTIVLLVAGILGLMQMCSASIPPPEKVSGKLVRESRVRAQAWVLDRDGEPQPIKK